MVCEMMSMKTPPSGIFSMVCGSLWVDTDWHQSIQLCTELLGTNGSVILHPWKYQYGSSKASVAAGFQQSSRKYLLTELFLKNTKDTWEIIVRDFGSARPCCFQWNHYSYFKKSYAWSGDGQWSSELGISHPSWELWRSQLPWERLWTGTLNPFSNSNSPKVIHTC